jgi:hypothetical protein
LAGKSLSSAQKENFMYGTEPVSITLSDGLERRVRFTAAALRRVEKAIKALPPEEQTRMDLLAITLWEGLLDRGGIPDREALLELIDARAIPEINQKIEEVLPERRPNPPIPASN